MKRIPFVFTVLAGLCLLAGCADYPDLDYSPRPALAEIEAAPPDKSPPVSAFASVIGIRPADKDDDLPLSMEVRFRLENNGPHSVSFDPQTMMLTTGSLIDFDPPVTRPAHPVTLATNERAQFTAYFPFPPHHSYDNVDLRSLQLRWRLQLDGSNIGQVVSFNRIYPYHRYYYDRDPYWGYGYPAYYYGGGVVFYGRHRY
jgi:hypothetical protein